VLDLVQPQLAGRRLRSIGGKARRNEAHRQGTRTQHASHAITALGTAGHALMQGDGQSSWGSYLFRPSRKHLQSNRLGEQVEYLSLPLYRQAKMREPAEEATLGLSARLTLVATIRARTCDLVNKALSGWGRAGAVLFAGHRSVGFGANRPS
jgi:hypothetical protein